MSPGMRDHGAIGGKLPNRSKERADGGGWAVVGASTTSTMSKIEPTRCWAAASCAARGAQDRLSRARDPPQVGHGAAVQDDPVTQPLLPIPQARGGSGEKVPRQPQAVVGVAGYHGVAEQLELLAHRPRRGQDFGVQLGPKNV